MEGLIILLLFAVVAMWLFGRVTKKMRVPVTPAKYRTVAVIVVIGVLLLYVTQR